MPYDNETWIAALRRADAGAALELRAALVARTHHALQGRPGVDDAFVEDVVHDSLAKIYARLDQFQGRSQFLTWATAIALRVAMSEMRRARWRDVSLQTFTEETGQTPPSPPPQSGDPLDAMHRDALLDALREAMREELSPRQCAALTAELKGMSQDAIAQELGSTRNALYKLTHDARKKLKRRLEAAGFTAADLRPQRTY
ncbi:MAG: sigma-70 family RNA polymerase sigma factor [Planctomycetales bacterium]|nr:sigma-70 family RNA polymerase sigma factor [Planctomycetales bacterium]